MRRMLLLNWSLVVSCVYTLSLLLDWKLFERRDAVTFFFVASKPAQYYVNNICCMDIRLIELEITISIDRSAIFFLLLKM